MSEDIGPKRDLSEAPDDLGGLFNAVIERVPWKVISFVFIAFIIINTSTFVDNVLAYWPESVEGRYPSEQGLMIQACMLAFGAILVSICAEGELI